MKIIRISAIWCSSCLVMKSKFNDIIKNYNIELIDYDYDLDEEEFKKYNIGDILPVYIKIDNGKEINRMIGEHSKEEIIKFIEG